MPPRAFGFGLGSLMMAAVSIVSTMARARTFEQAVDLAPIAGEPITVPAVMPAHKERYLYTRAVDRDIAVCTRTTRRAARRARGRAAGAARLASIRRLAGGLPA